MSISERQQIISANNVIIAENEQKVFNAGYEKGKAEGGDAEAAYNQGYTEGKQAEYDAFWDSFQSNGARINYQYGFCGGGWTDETFKHKYLIAPTGVYAYYMFQNSGFKKPDLSNVDFSKCGGLVQTFYGSTVEELGVLNFSSMGAGFNGFNGTFNSCLSLRIIAKIILPNESVGMNGFFNCTSLEEIRFEGTIYRSANFQWSPLSKASIENIIGCLDDTASDQTVIFKVDAVNTAFETAESLADGSTSAEWLALIATKPNWTISLV